jgi:hypothetical protein
MTSARRSRGARLRGGLMIVAVSLAMGLCPAAAQTTMLTYSSGQTVAPAYEGWEQEADGSKYFVFGYMNRNWQEEPDVPIGPDNTFNVGAADQGQPTHFLPRRNRFVFSVKVPDAFSETDEMVWTLTTHGQTIKAYASLRLDYKIDNMVRMSETGALGAGSSSPDIRANKPPQVELETASTITAHVGEPVEIVAIVTDDGVPQRRGAGLVGAAVQNVGSRSANDTAPDSAGSVTRVNRDMRPPSRSTVGKNVGLHQSWFVYRGPGGVTFDPPQIKPWEDTRAGANSPWAPVWVAPDMPSDGRIVVRATFAKPGTYVLRGLADDGGLTSSQDVTVTVTP